MLRFGYGLMGFGLPYLIMTAAAVLIILGIIALIRYIRVTGHGHKIEISNTNTALQILNERYAKGELNDEEYRTKKAEILK